MTSIKLLTVASRAVQDNEAQSAAAQKESQARIARKSEMETWLCASGRIRAVSFSSTLSLAHFLFLPRSPTRKREEQR